MDDTCVCCGAYCGEGRQICYKCERTLVQNRSDSHTNGTGLILRGKDKELHSETGKTIVGGRG